ncbi:MAG: zinc ribbon domain-containing protein [Proteobacteria bacterium]|nr:zinc ribbon domain-containing protein [Pseudomonadota bacterium]
MPIYEFHCDQCNLDFEYLVIGKDKPFCPSCKTKKIHKLMSSCGFVSKGAGGGETVKSSASSSGCGSCSATSCGTCGSC